MIDVIEKKKSGKYATIEEAVKSKTDKINKLLAKVDKAQLAKLSKSSN
jgi:hypothetical protein